MVEQAALRGTPAQATEHQNSLWNDCADSFLQAAVQKPVTAVSQIVDQVAGTHLTDKTHFVAPAEEAKFGSGHWLAEQISGGVGAAIPYLAAAIVAKPLANGLVGNPLLRTGMAAADVARTVSFAETAAAGAGTGFFLTPSADNNQFWADRLHSGISSAVTMSSLHLLSHGLGNLTGANTINASIGIKALNTGLAGAGAGVVGAETQSMLSTGKPAEWTDIYQSAIGMGITGGVLGAAGDGLLRLNQPRSSLPMIEEHVARQYNGEDSLEHYLGHQARKSPLEWPRIVGRLVEDARKNAEQGGNEDGMSFGLGRVNLKLSDWSPVDRINLVAQLERLAQSPLVKPEPLAQFIGKMRDMSEQWQKDPIEELAKKADAAQEDYVAKVDAFHAREGEIWEAGRHTHWVDDEGWHSGSKGDDQLIASLREQLDKDRQVRDQHRDAYNAVLDRRASEIEQAVNSFLKDQRLPEVTVKAAPWVGGSASYGMGGLNVLNEIMESPTLQNDTIGIVFHELVHLEQDNLRIRLAADKMGIGKSASDEQIAQLLKRVHPEITEEIAKVSPEKMGAADQEALNRINTFIKDIVNLRDGQTLSPEEASRAERLGTAQRRYQAPWNETESAIHGKQLNIENMRNNDDMVSMLQQIDARPEDFGFKKLPDELQPLLDKVEEKYPSFKSWSAPELNVGRTTQDLPASVTSGSDTAQTAANGESAADGKGGADWLDRWRTDEPEQMSTNAHQMNPEYEQTALDREETDLINEHDRYHQETDPDHEEIEPEPTEQPEESKSRDDELFNAQQQKLFNDILDKQFDKLGKQADRYGVRSYRWYMNNALEQEAYPAGLLAFLMAQAKTQPSK